MTLTMNDSRMKRLLEEIRPEGETYLGMAWGTLLDGPAKMLALGGIGSIPCYVGITKNFLAIAATGIMDSSSLCGSLCIPLDQLEKIRVAHGLFPFQKIIRIQAEGIKLRFSLSNNSATARVRNQRESVQIICDTLNAA